jgi:regulatory protein
MAATGSASPVAQAAAWLSRQGVAVPDADRSAGPGRGEVGGSSLMAEEPASQFDIAGSTDPDPPPDGDTDPYAVARSIALDRIATRDRTRHELAQALKARNVPAEVAEQVLDRLQEVGLVNDTAFAAAWVESRQQRRHLSRPALRRELQAKGVDRDTIDDALESVDFGNELAAARELARRRHAAIAGLPYPVRYRRLAGVLSRRGFGTAIVTQVLRETVGGE